MNSDRWSYQVVEVAVKLFSSNAAQVQERLNQLGAQGWELVSVIRHPAEPTRLYLKKRL